MALSSWKPFQSRLPSAEEIGAWFGAETGGAMCLVCGAVSGNLEMIDFDLCGEAFGAWREAVSAAAPGLMERLVIDPPRRAAGMSSTAAKCRCPATRSSPGGASRSAKKDRS